MWVAFGSSRGSYLGRCSIDPGTMGNPGSWLAVRVTVYHQAQTQAPFQIARQREGEEKKEVSQKDHKSEWKIERCAVRHIEYVLYMQ